jgi:hypothetical protein
VGSVMRICWGIGGGGWTVGGHVMMVLVIDIRLNRASETVQDEEYRTVWSKTSWY